MKTSWTEEQFREAIAESPTYADVLRKLGLSVRPGNYSTINKYIKKWGLDTSHMKGQSHLLGKKRLEIRLSDTEVFVRDSDFSRTHLKARIMKDGLIENRCAICNGEPIWRGGPLVLRLDHINGNNRDARLCNLRMLCPNCDSQTDTFCRGKKQPGG